MLLSIYINMYSPVDDLYIILRIIELRKLIYWQKRRLCADYIAGTLVMNIKQKTWHIIKESISSVHISKPKHVG